MLSKGSKRRYRCPDCHSTNISFAIILGQRSYSCDDCNTFGPWSHRKTESADAIHYSPLTEGETK